MKQILVACSFLVVGSLLSQTKYTVNSNDFKAAIGFWKGSLTYLDYASGKPYTMPANITLHLYGDKADAIIFALQKLLKTLKDNPKLKVEIQGHVCCTNNGEDGVDADYDTREPKLSENRAKAIYEYLIDKGIAKSRLTYKGYGRSKPKEPIEDTPEKEQANRRVEILILEK